MTARLIRPDGTVEREWQTTRPDLALTADRNFPAGWHVEVLSNWMRCSGSGADPKNKRPAGGNRTGRQAYNDTR